MKSFLNVDTIPTELTTEFIDGLLLCFSDKDKDKDKGDKRKTGKDQEGIRSTATENTGEDETDDEVTEPVDGQAGRRGRTDSVGREGFGEDDEGDHTETDGEEGNVEHDTDHLKSRDIVLHTDGHHHRPDGHTSSRDQQQCLTTQTVNEGQTDDGDDHIQGRDTDSDILGRVTKGSFKDRGRIVHDGVDTGQLRKGMDDKDLEGQPGEDGNRDDLENVELGFRFKGGILADRVVKASGRVLVGFFRNNLGFFTTLGQTEQHVCEFGFDVTITKLQEFNTGFINSVFTNQPTRRSGTERKDDHLDDGRSDSDDDHHTPSDSRVQAERDQFDDQDTEGREELQDGRQSTTVLWWRDFRDIDTDHTS